MLYDRNVLRGQIRDVFVTNFATDLKLHGEKGSNMGKSGLQCKGTDEKASGPLFSSHT